MANHARSSAYMLSRYIELENVNVTIFFVSSPEIVIQLNKWVYVLLPMQGICGTKIYFSDFNILL